MKALLVVLALLAGCEETDLGHLGGHCYSDGTCASTRLECMNTPAGGICRVKEESCKERP